MKQQKWWQSWGLWVSLAALVAYVARTIFHVDIVEWLDGFMAVLLPVLIAFGIVNNPNTRGALGYTQPALKTEDVKEAEPYDGVE